VRFKSNTVGGHSNSTNREQVEWQKTTYSVANGLDLRDKF